jgi:hypothetical protein
MSAARKPDPLGHYDGFSIRDFMRDLIGAASAGLFVWSVVVWAPYFAH